MAIPRQKLIGRATATVVKMRSAGIRRGTILPSIRGMTPIGIGMIPGIIVIMAGTVLGMIPGTTVATIGIIPIGMAAIITLSMVAAVDVVGCMPATATQVPLT